MTPRPSGPAPTSGPRRARAATAAAAAAVLLAAVGTAVVGAPAAWAGPEPASPGAVTMPGIVVKADQRLGYTIDDVVRQFPVVVSAPVIDSREIYLVRPSDPRRDDPAGSRALADRMARSSVVAYAEVDSVIEVSDTRFHSWPAGSPQSAQAQAYADQPVVSELALQTVHDTTRGADQVVAVLDTGVEAEHAALDGRVGPGWDYVADDDDPADEPSQVDSDHDGEVDGSLGHGTFVSGLVHLVAPDATIMPMRVLDADGNGSLFAVAQAISDATAAGADVVNLSFGSRDDRGSRLLDDAIKQARDAGVVVVVAAGNEGSDRPRYPASRPEVLSVAATTADETALASFSNRGDWVQVAAPGSDLVGPVTGGAYATWSGTSMAAPLAAGQAALVGSARPQLDARRLVELIGTSARPARGIRVLHGVVDLVASLRGGRGGPGHR